VTEERLLTFKIQNLMIICPQMVDTDCSRQIAAALRCYISSLASVSRPFYEVPMSIWFADCVRVI